MLDTLPPELLEYIAYYTHTLAPSDVLSLSLTHTHLLFCLLRTPVSRDLCKSLFGPLACANRRWWRAARLSLDTTLAVASAHRPPFSDTLPLSVLSSTRFAVRNALISTLLAPASSLLPLEVGQHGKTVAAFIKSLPTPDLEAAFDLSPKLFPLATPPLLPRRPQALVLWTPPANLNLYDKGDTECYARLLELFRAQRPRGARRSGYRPAAT